MDKSRVLVVDDEPEIVGIVAYALETYIFPETQGCEVITAYNGQQALDRFETSRPDLVVLDILMPGMDGLEVFRRLRRARSKIPVILLTVRDSEADVVRGYELGADGYVTKPFSSRELALQAQAILRRCGREADASVITNGPLQINTRTHQVTLDGREISLSPLGFRLLAYLAHNSGNVCAYADLLKEVWKCEPWEGDNGTVKATVSRLRQKIESDTGQPRYILAVKSVGYKMPKLG